jgi:hypothetical protein
MSARIDFDAREFSPVEYRITRPKPAQTNRVKLISDSCLHPQSPLGQLAQRWVYGDPNDKRPSHNCVRLLNEEANEVAKKLRALNLDQVSSAEYVSLKSQLELLEARIAEAEPLARERSRDDHAREWAFRDAYSRYYCLVRQINFEAEFLNYEQREKILAEINEMTRPVS